MAVILLLVVLIAVALALGMARAHAWQWTAGLGAVILAWQCGLFHGTVHPPHIGVSGVLLWFALAALGALSITEVRRRAVVQPAFKMVRSILPKVSDTEQQALDAGTVGFDAEIFSGTPDWTKLRAVPPIVLTPEERAFLDGPTAELCRRIDHWQIRHAERRMPDEIWDFVKKHGFLGMLISKEHGGLGFSAQAQSLILGKIASRSPDVVTIVMVPNSLGPGELIEKYGTDDQKHHYLPRLAKGLEVPCFSLTGPTSGSDAATMRD
ncbi:MAG: acyl-CoA dehydrogenase family protein, partial [Hyphomicrobium sp.]|uniref:acyl-CoA dehydrogenase family protein n=1 Tax=Hyphomicrobium sp. TaxID=82 RepID=UPI003D1449A1